MPENARIFLTEDDDRERYYLLRDLKEWGHQVVFIGTNRAEAIEGVSKIGELEPDVAVLDGNLEYIDAICESGRLVARLIKSVNPNVKVIAYTSSTRFGDYGDVYVNKGDIKKLSKEIKSA